MPRIDELPVPAQNELRAMRGEGPAGEPPQKQRMGLLQRLASVGLGGSGRREDEPNHAPEAPTQQPPRQRMGPIPQPPARPMQPRPARPPEQSRPEPVSEYAKRPPHQGLDPLGRQAPVHNSSEEDQLDIPAFLRRQAK
jgi:cell division protein FtsZ